MSSNPDRPIVHVPREGIRRTEKTEAAWTALDIATSVVRSRPQDARVLQIYREAIAKYHASLPDRREDT